MSEGQAEWDRTQIMKRRLAEQISRGPDGRGYYQGRPVIHSDTRVLGGVYLGAFTREAIVVDEKYGELNRLYEEAKKRVMDSAGKVNKGKILKSVFEVVKETMKPSEADEAKVNEIIEKLGVSGDRKIALDVFIKKGVGVCRHRALACAALLELFKRDGHIRGISSVDRNSTELGSHAWCRYTNSKGEVFILDPTLGFLGSLNEAESRGIWQYKRPEDY